MYVNKVFLYGNLGRDPELRSLPSGMKVVSFPIATTRIYKDKSGTKQSQTDWHNIVVFGKMAETAAQYLKKGSPLFVEGRIQTRSWEDKDGNKQYRTEIVVDNFQFGPGNVSSNVNNSQENLNQDLEPATQDDFVEQEGEINPDDIPF